MAHEAEFLRLLADGVFRVDPDGSIWRLATFGRTGKRRPIEPQRCDHERGNGYRAVNFTVGGRRVFVAAHRATFSAMVRLIQAAEELNHRNGAKGDNAPTTNLEVISRGGNIEHAYRVLGRRRLTGEANPASKLTDDEAHELLALKGTLSSRKAGALYGISHRQVLNIWSGKR
ncbi:hypothetical protein [Piscinibacter defluvii]|uniref:hypothetical protein n=1 Tax=Piscinibacter defluvii TaxID=1796922 RepID=UPI000FDE0925|nr:hypothetical protein [Piscinibacter defluvii]